MYQAKDKLKSVNCVSATTKKDRLYITCPFDSNAGIDYSTKGL